MLLWLLFLSMYISGPICFPEHAKALFSLSRFVKNLFVFKEFIAWRKVENLEIKGKLFLPSLTGLLCFKFRRNNS